MATASHIKNHEEPVSLTLSVEECFSLTTELHYIDGRDKPLSTREEHLLRIHNALYNLINKALKNEGTY